MNKYNYLLKIGIVLNFFVAGIISSKIFNSKIFLILFLGNLFFGIQNLKYLQVVDND